MSQSQASQKQKSDKQSKKTPVATQAQRDQQYKAPKDNIWGDVIRHEQVLEKRWSETWTDTIVPKELRPPNYNKSGTKEKKFGDDAKSFYQPKPSPAVPIKASAIIGWRSSDPAYSMEYFDVRYVSNKIRFIPEQYGAYRHVKYLKPEPEQPTKDPMTSPPGKRIRHVVKCLVC